MLEPAPYALDYLVKWRGDVVIGDKTYAFVPVLEFVRSLVARPEEYGVTPEQAAQARQSFLTLAGGALEAEGGDVAWLERELQR